MNDLKRLLAKAKTRAGERDAERVHAGREDEAYWTRMFPQPFVVVNGRIDFFDKLHQSPGNRIRLRTPTLRGFTVGVNLGWYDQDGKAIHPRELMKLVQKHGADYCAWRESSWPIEAGALLTGDQFRFHPQDTEHVQTMARFATLQDWAGHPPQPFNYMVGKAEPLRARDYSAISFQNLKGDRQRLSEIENPDEDLTDAWVDDASEIGLQLGSALEIFSRDIEHHPHLAIVRLRQDDGRNVNVTFGWKRKDIPFTVHDPHQATVARHSFSWAGKWPDLVNAIRKALGR